MTDENSSDVDAENSAPNPQPRRNAMTSLLAGVISAVVGIVPFASGLLFFLDPITRKKSGDDEDEFIPIGITADSLPNDGTPMMVRIVADKIDAWNKYTNVPIGTVWLSRRNGEIKCFNTVCPHLGCSVDYRPSEHDYFCPCHTSAFDLDGGKKNEIPPRDMDGLEVRVTDGKLEVAYKNFRAGIPDQTPV